MDTYTAYHINWWPPDFWTVERVVFDGDVLTVNHVWILRNSTLWLIGGSGWCGFRKYLTKGIVTDSYLGTPLESQTTHPNHQFTIVWQEWLQHFRHVMLRPSLIGFSQVFQSLDFLDCTGDSLDVSWQGFKDENVALLWRWAVGAKRTNILAMAQDLLDTPKMDLYKAMPLRGNKWGGKVQWWEHW